MPRVPTADNQVREAGVPNARNTFRSSPEDFGAGLSRGINDVAQVSNEIRVDAVHKANRINVDDAANQLGAWESNAMPKALQVRGKNAFGLPDTVMADYDKTADKIAQGLANDEQRAAFAAIRADRRNGVNKQLQSHMGAEMSEYDKTTTDSLLTNSHNAVGLYYGDEGRVNEELDRQAFVIQDYAERNGLPPEWVQEKKMASLTASHSTVIDQFLTAEDDVSAKAHLDRYEAEMTPDARTAARKAIDVAGTRGESQRQASAIFSTEKTLDAMVDEARQIKDPKIQDATVERIVKLKSIYDQAKSEKETALFKQGYEILSDPNNVRGIDAVPATVMSQLTPEKAETLRRYAQRDTKAVTNRGVYLALQQMAARDPVQFSKPGTLLDAMNDLSDQDFQELSRLQRETIESGNKGPAVTGIIARDEVVNRALAGLGIDPKPYTVKDGVATVNQPAVVFTDLVNRAIIAEQTATGKPVTPERVQQITDKLVIEQAQEIPASGFGRMVNFTGFGLPGAVFGIGRPTATTVPTFQVPGADRMALVLAQVPETEATEIRNAAARAGRALSNDDVVSIYNASLRNRANAGQ